jgi:sugar lactone lactonase YvrE
MRLNSNRSQAVDVLVHHDVSTPDGLAFDWIHKNLYWTDTGNNRIDVLSLSTAAGGPAMRKTLFDVNLDEPRAIVVDPRDDQRRVMIASPCKLFIVNATHSIHEPNGTFS